MFFFMETLRMAHSGPLEGMKDLGVGAKGENKHFHLLLQKRLTDFNQTWLGSSSGGRDQNLSMWSRCHKDPQGDKLKESSSPGLKAIQTGFLYVDYTFIYKE